MKKLIFFPLFFLASMSFSQEVESTDETVYKRNITFNELSIGALNLVAFGAVDVAYERIINSNSSWSIEAFILALNRNNEDLPEAYTKDFSLTGKWKYFFSERHAWGFYVNGLSMISTGEHENDTSYIDRNGNYVWSVEKENYTDFALGFGLGGKFVAKQGFFIDLNTGIGRNLFSKNSPTIIGQFNANIGFRF